MKGLVFTEFLEMIEENFSLEIVEKIIEQSNLPNNGAYTAVGTYDFHELVRLVTNLGAEVKISVSDLQIAYGKYLFKKLRDRYVNLVGKIPTFFDFLKQLDQYIHVEVHKLYSDAELPRFECKELDEKTVQMKYRSKRPFADLAEGLIRGCADFYHEKVNIKRETLPKEDENKINCELFTITKA